METIHTDVLIVGAGLTGLTLACDLMRRNVSFIIIDQLPEPFTGSRGKTLQPRSLEILEDLGVVEKVLDSGRFHTPIKLYNTYDVETTKDLAMGLDPTADIPYECSFWIPQFQVENILREQLAAGGKQVLYNTALTQLQQHTDFVTATVFKGDCTKQLTCKYVVAADGNNSFVRQELNLAFTAETQPSFKLLVADVHTNSLDPEHLHVWNNSKGMLSICGFKNSSIFQLIAQIPTNFNQPLTLATVQNLVNTLSGHNTIALYNPTWLTTYAINLRMVNQYKVGNILLAGDAAHEHTHLGSHGMNTGMQDAYNLGWKLDAVLNGASESLLDTYEEERLPVAAHVLELSRQLLENFENEKELPKAKQVLQLTIDYRKSSLSMQDTHIPLPVHAGDRAPDAPICNFRDDVIRLFSLFKGAHFTVLYYGKTPTTEFLNLCTDYHNIKCYHISPEDSSILQNRYTTFLDSANHFKNAYGATNNTIYVIRPDGYIGYINTTNDIIGVHMYLDPISAPHQITI